MRNFIILLLILLIISTTAILAGKKDVSKKEYPKEWCFKVNSGYLTCSDYNVFFVVTKGKTTTMYGLNGSAKSFSQVKGKYKKGYDDIDKIVIRDKKTKLYTGNYSFFLEMGKKLCR